MCFFLAPSERRNPISRVRSVTLASRSEEHTSELQSPDHLVCRLLLEKKNYRPAPPVKRPCSSRLHTPHCRPGRTETWCREVTRQSNATCRPLRAPPKRQSPSTVQRVI